MNSTLNDKLTGKRALVTGGGSGIGAAIVRELADQGARVAIHYFTSATAAEALAQEIRGGGGDALTVQADLSDEQQVKALFATLRQRWDGLDVLVNNAGDLIGRRGIQEVEMEFYRKVLAVNLDSMVLVTREAVALMKEALLQGAGGASADGAAIVNLSSLAGRKGGHAGSLIYSTAKGAVLALTRALAAELGPAGIRVNAVAPGLILGSRFHAVHTSEESKRQTIEGIPLGRAGVCEDVARAVAYLASEYDGFITGATLDVNGGVYMA